MSIFEIAADIAEALLSGGIPGPTTLDGQRRARLVIAAVALIVAFFVWAPPTRTVAARMLIMVAGVVIVSGWVCVFSMVDMIKERRVLPLGAASVVLAATALSLAIHAGVCVGAA